MWRYCSDGAKGKEKGRPFLLNLMRRHSCGNMSSIVVCRCVLMELYSSSLAPAHMGGEQAHQGHCLWLILKSMKAAFSLHAIHLCFCFLCLQRFVLHIGLDLQHLLNPVITPLFLHKLAFMLFFLFFSQCDKQIMQLAYILFP